MKCLEQCLAHGKCLMLGRSATSHYKKCHLLDGIIKLCRFGGVLEPFTLSYES